MLLSLQHDREAMPLVAAIEKIEVDEKTVGKSSFFAADVKFLRRFGVPCNYAT